MVSATMRAVCIGMARAKSVVILWLVFNIRGRSSFVVVLGELDEGDDKGCVLCRWLFI